MSPARIDRVATFILSVFYSSILAQDSFVIPPVRIQAFRPRGVRVSMPDVPGITLFAFNGNINKGITPALEFGQIRSEVKAPVNGRWIFEKPSIQLNVGDVINYYVMVETDLMPGSIFVTGHYSGSLRYKVERLEDESSISSRDQGCDPSLTAVYESTGQICSGQVLLEDRFFSIRNDVWQIEHYIPVDNPEYPFLSYQRSAVTLADRYLNIEAKLQENEPGFTNASIYCRTLDLFDGCTKQSCSKQASGADILPPVVSGRLISKGFAFKYGIVHVRAKFPIGDWLYPEIMLEPMTKKYGGMNYASGVLKIATAKGNEVLTAGTKDYSNKLLYGGPITSVDCQNQLLQENLRTDKKLWSDDFHIYSLRWTPDSISLSVDGKEWGYIEPGKKKLRERFPQKCNVPAYNGTKMAPFDEFFYLTLGVSVGGITEFHDDVKTRNDWPKPWKNASRKAMLNFWRDQASWHATWKRPKMLVDYQWIEKLDTSPTMATKLEKEDFKGWTLQTKGIANFSSLFESLFRIDSTMAAEDVALPLVDASRQLCSYGLLQHHRSLHLSPRAA